MEWLLKLGLVALVGYFTWKAFGPRYVFVVRVVRGVPKVARGKVTPAFLKEVAEACGRFKVARGTIRGVARGHRIALAFDGRIPVTCQQQLRNVWEYSGWSAKPRRG